MEKILFCMSLAYIKHKFHQKLDEDDLDTSRKYMQWNSDVHFYRHVINNHVVGNA